MKKDTKELLIDSAFNSFYKNGYQGANISTILKEVGINKGSMYHFFKSKKELGLAVIKERIEKNLIKKYKKILEDNRPIESLFKTLISAPDTLIYGCPLNKMSQEMVYIDEEFKKLLSKIYKEFEKLIEDILIKGIQKKEISHCQTLSTAQLIIATYEGALMIYHLNRDKKQYIEILSELKVKLALPN